jgi:hypothetical protein
LKKRLSHGKKIGFAAFVIYEIIVSLLVIYQGVIIFKGLPLDQAIVNGILLSQGTIFSIVWGAKAASNFANKDEK